MVCKKTWVKRWSASGMIRYIYTGWFFLGFIPLYIKRETV